MKPFKQTRLYYHLEPWILPAIVLGAFLIAVFGYPHG